MARIRSIKPGYGTSEAIAVLSLGCELHFAKLWTYCDDHGRAIDNPRLIKGAIWPLRDEVDVHQVADWQDELARAGRIVRYEVDGKRYFEVVNWAEHQHPNRPVESEYPAPPPTSGNDVFVQGHVRDTARAVQTHVPDDAVVVVGEGDVDGEGEEPSPSSPDSVNSDRPRRAQVSPPATDDLGPSFDDFWERYPRRNGKRVGKQATIDRWKAMTVVDRHSAVVAAQHYADAVARGLTIAKDPERFLAKRYWAEWDEPASHDPPRLVVSNGHKPTNVERSWANIRSALADEA